MKNILIKIGEFTIIASCVALLFILDIKEILSHIPEIHIFKRNLDFIDGTLDSYFLLLILIGIITSVCIIKNRISISIPSISVGGVKIYLKNTEKIVKANIRNYLNTKRSLFYIDLAADNFYDVFSSYHCIYNYVREQMSFFEDIKNTENECYEKLDTMIVSLNNFLTRFQSDYRRWYEMEIRNDFKMLNELQISYPKYLELEKGFQDINVKMRGIASYFGVNVEKWEVLQ